MKFKASYDLQKITLLVLQVRFNGYFEIIVARLTWAKLYPIMLEVAKF